MNYGVVILVGGKSSRMGTPKLQLQLNGIRFLDKLVYELSGFPELLVSVDDERRHPEIPYPMVSDAIADCGPMGGLYTALKHCACDALVTVPCDVPLFSREIADRLCAGLAEKAEKADAVIMLTQDGKEHPLCGVYKKSCLAVLEQCLQQKNYRMRDALAKLKVKKYQAGRASWRLMNINTPEDFLEVRSYERSCGQTFNTPEDFPEVRSYERSCGQTQNCLAVSGWKNSGKTTLIEKLIPILAQKGLKTAVIKHDGHSYEPDVPGTDSFRFFQAGADISVIYDKNKYSLTRRTRMADKDVLNLAYGADIILLEGFKWSSYPKIEIVRREISRTPIPGLQGRIAYASDMELFMELSMKRSMELFMELPVLKLHDTQGIAAFIIEAYENGRLITPQEKERG